MLFYVIPLACICRKLCGEMKTFLEGFWQEVTLSNTGETLLDKTISVDVLKKIQSVIRNNDNRISLKHTCTSCKVLNLYKQETQGLDYVS